MTRIIYESSLKDLARKLSKSARVFVPVKNHPHSTFGQYSFEEFSEDSILAFDYPTTNIPPKEFLIPAREVLFEYGESGPKEKSKEKQVIFGVSVEDLAGLHRLDTIFSRPIDDAAYKKTRESTFIIGVDHFTPEKSLNFDLYLQRVKSDMFIGYAKTKFGQEILKSNLFQDHKMAVPKVTKKDDVLFSDSELAKIVESSKDHPVWEELAEICFGCGICSYVCPLCYCFETEDTLDLTKNEPCGERCRNWDSCMLKTFSDTNAKNFRPELADRIYNWYFHKFVRMEREYGFNGCVDCNRCVIYCPAKINYRTTLHRLISDYKKTLPTKKAAK